MKCDGTRAETRFSLSAKRTSLFKSAGASVQSTTGSRGVRISGSNAGYTMFRCSVKSTGYPFHSPVSPSLPLPCVTVCHHVSTGVCQPSLTAWSTTLLEITLLFHISFKRGTLLSGLAVSRVTRLHNLAYVCTILRPSAGCMFVQGYSK